jgi:hypothetical protein
LAPNPALGAGDPKAAKDGGAAEKPAPPRPKPISSRSLAHLYTLISGQPTLAPLDLEYYIINLPLILGMDENPENAQVILEGTGWTEDRLAYVCVKVGIGLMSIMDQESQRLKRYPYFVTPTAEEMELIVVLEPEISKAYRAAIKAQNQKAPKAPQQRRSR